MEQPRSTVSYTESHKRKGRDYHDSFTPAVNPYRAMHWHLERRVLDQILGNHLSAATVAHLDFACGTGRILSHFLRRVASVTGVDVSPSMMKVAQEVAPGAELIEADLTQRDVLGERRFDLITAFRFFPNAEPELRRKVLEVLVRHLNPQGVLVFNNHKNHYSLPRRIARLLGREAPGRTMAHSDVQELVTRAGLTIGQVIPLAILPFSENHPIVPASWLELVERRLGGHRALTGIAQDVIYVCNRASSS